MRKPRSMFQKAFILWLAAAQLLSLAACSSPAPSATATPEPSATRTFTPLPSATLTASPLPSLTPSLVPSATRIPSATPVPKPSATPPGFYSHFSAGFSLIYPTSWTLREDDPNSLSLVDPTKNVYIYLWSEATKTPQTPADLEKRIADLAAEEKETFTTLSQGTLALADGVELIYADYDLLSAANGSTTVRVGAAQKGNRSYSLMLYARPGALQERTQTIERILTSLRLFVPAPFGLPHNQTLTLLGWNPDPRDLDPATCTGSMDDYIGLLYSGLVRITPDLQIAPDLAEKWTISPDGLVYTFTLRPELKFASGNPITADSVKFSWERAFDPANESSTARTYLGDIAGSADVLAGKAEGLSGLKVIDARTLQVTLSSPRTTFLAKIAYPTGTVVDEKRTKAVLKDGEVPYQSNGSGPYIVKQYDSEKGLVFERNPNYHTPAFIPYVVFILSPGGSGLSLYEEGSIDLYYPSFANRKQLSDPAAALHAELQTMPQMCTTMIRLNPSLAPLDDLKVRQALAQATDKARLLEVLTENQNMIADTILPPAMPGFLPERKLLSYDPAAAALSLSQSKYAGKLPPITLVAAGTAESSNRSIDALIDMWKKNLGITVQVRYIESASFDSTVKANPGHLLIYGWCADYPDPENFLETLFYSGGDFNLMKTSLPEFDKLIDQGRGEMDVTRRLLAYQQAETLLLDQVDSIPLFHNVEGVLVKPRLKEFVQAPFGLRTIPYIKLAPESPSGSGN